MQTSMDELFMTRALELAALGKGHTSPNPMVGAVIVKDNKIIAEGYHHKAGEAHAEVNAFNDAATHQVDVHGATLYVTLEPCAHYGKTPPCAKRVVEEGIQKVVIGTMDPNPLVSGKGLKILQDAHIQTKVGIMEEACINLNEQFLTSFSTGLPFVTVKSAMSLDGKIATVGGESQWITNKEARLDGHYLRATHDVILTGIGTILADNPTLNVRMSIEEQKKYNLFNPKNPDLVILDHNARTPLTSNIWKVTNRKIIIFVGLEADKSAIEQLNLKGAEVIVLNKIDLNQVLHILGERHYLSILVEGGSQIIASFVEDKLVDKFIVYLGDKVIGGTNAIPAIGGKGFQKLVDTLRITYKDVKFLGNNVRIEAYTERNKC